jgi:hypothetical protein
LKYGVFKRLEKIFRRLHQEAYRTISAAAIMIKNGKAVVFREKDGGNKTKTKARPKNPEPVHHKLTTILGMVSNKINSVNMKMIIIFILRLAR